jgi:hypothetical protein
MRNDVGDSDERQSHPAPMAPAIKLRFLPFNDDPVLSLILSKTFLLAADTEISARAILAQI